MAAQSVDWELVTAQLAASVDKLHWLSALANASALLNEVLEDINWVGFYLVGSSVDQSLGRDELVLGPFQGKVACVSIPWGRGVCGTAAERDQTVRVDDVHTFAGHIACDAASRSEIVVPIHAQGHLVGVLDIDSPLLARFSSCDQEGLEACVTALEQRICW